MACSAFPYTCPNCNGTLWQVGEDEPLRFRCHVGHTFIAESMFSEQTRTLENTLWSALRLMEEKVMLSRRMAERRRAVSLPEAAQRYEQYADKLDQEVAILRNWIESGFATRYIDEGSAPHQKPPQAFQTKTAGG